MLLLLLSLKAMAAACWITSPAVINFGAIAAGNAASTHAEVKFSCQADNLGTTEYINVCLSSIDAPPFQMVSPGDQEGKQYTLIFRILNGVARSQELGPASRGDLIQQTLTADSNANISGSFPLIATLPAGQSQLPAYHYYNYNMNLRIAWHSASRQDALQNCSDGSAEGEQVQGGSNAQAEIREGCYIEHVTPLNFGTLTSTATLRPTRSTATLTTRCPAAPRSRSRWEKAIMPAATSGSCATMKASACATASGRMRGPRNAGATKAAAMRCRSPTPRAGRRISPSTETSRRSP